MRLERTSDAFRAMNTDIDIELWAPRPVDAALFRVARDLFAEQEARFSRFREDSLLSRVNGGEAVTDSVFAAGVRLALNAYEITGGLFNPMILGSLEAAGYDRTFDEVQSTETIVLPQPTPDPRPYVVVDGDTVRMHWGRLDLGGIVKGWTVDLVTERLWASGVCEGVLVNAGGDLRTAGSDGDEGWELAIELPGGRSWQARLDGALATSTTLRRRWEGAAGQVRHHLIDPRTGLPATSGVVQASVHAPHGTCRDAETWAKAVVIGGDEAAHAAASSGLAVLFVRENGDAVPVNWTGEPTPT